MKIKCLVVGLIIVNLPVADSQAQRACKSDYDCRSDGGHNCGEPAAPYTSARATCYCYQQHCIEHHEFIKAVQSEQWALERCRADFQQPQPRDACIRGVAFWQEDARVCKQISDALWIDGCIRDLAKHKADITLCTEIVNDWQRGLCTGYLATSAGQCESLKGQGQEFCFSEVAMRMNDLPLCEKAGGYKFACVNAVKEHLQQ